MKRSKKDKISSEKNKELLDNTGSVFNEGLFRAKLEKILSLFIGELNLDSEEKKKLYNKYYNRIEDIYFQKNLDLIKIKVKHGKKFHFNRYDFEKLEYDLENILSDIDTRFNKLFKQKSTYSQGRKYTDSMFDYCIMKKEKFNIKFEKSVDDIPQLWEIKGFNRDSFLRSLSTYYNKRPKTSK